MKLVSNVSSNTGEFSDIKKLVDIGGGSGAWAQALVQRHPQLSVTIFDLKPVLDSAAKIIADENPAEMERIEFKPGNFFEDDYPLNADAFLLSNILHDWPPNQCGQIVQRIAKALLPGGKLFINECILEENKTEPKFSVFFNLLMAINHHAQQFTKSELDQLLLSHGFGSAKFIHTTRNYSLLVAVKQ